MLRSCTTAVEFYKNVAERGRWSDLLMEVLNILNNMFVMKTSALCLYVTMLFKSSRKEEFGILLYATHL